MTPSDVDYQRAVDLLLAGELVAIPTETVYGLGADAANPAAVAKIFAAKGRPADHPLIVHLAGHDAVDHWAEQVPPVAWELMETFWPGPLTLILKKQAWVPDAVTEAARDLVRAREDCRTDLMRARHRVSKLLLRHGIVWSGGKAWTNPHLAWLVRHQLPGPAQWALDEGVDQVLVTLARRKRLDAHIAQLAADSVWTPIVRRLGCLRGVSTLTGFALAVEIDDWTRFNGHTIGAYLGLVPCEHSSGQSRALGSITKTGNRHVRRLLVEAACHHKPAYKAGTTIRARWDLAPAAARLRGDAGNRRLHHRWAQFEKRKKNNNVAVVAIAREMAGWCWSLAMTE